MTVDRTEAGTTWSDLAKLDPLAAVIDPGDVIGAKNRTIDRVHKHAIGSVLKELRGQRALDFGCGTGRLSAWLTSEGAIVEGVDITPEMIDVACARKLLNARFSLFDGRAMPYADSSFDVAVSAYVIQYYLDDPAIAAEIVRVLRPGGLLVAIEQVTESEIGRGGDLAAYRRMLLGAGFSSVESRAVRLSDSRILNVVTRHPLLRHLPLLPVAIEVEARRLQELPLLDGRYADVRFVCHA